MVSINNDYLDTLSQTEDITVTVVGDVMLDRYISGNATRLSAESPVPIVLVESEKEILGGAGNVVANLCGLGANVNIVSCVGSDRNGKIVQELLERSGCNTKGLIQSKDSQTITKTRVLAQRHQIVRFDYENISLVNHESLLLKLAKEAIESSQMVIISDYQKGTFSAEELSYIINYGKQVGVPTLVDPKKRNFSVYRDSSCITPNLNELMYEFPDLENSDTSIYQAGLTLKQRYNIGTVLITRGADGMSLLHGDDDIIHIPTNAKEVFDVTGAGDTVISTMSVCLALGFGYEISAYIANIAAGIVVSYIGTTPIQSAELMLNLRENFI